MGLGVGATEGCESGVGSHPLVISPYRGGDYEGEGEAIRLDALRHSVMAMGVAAAEDCESQVGGTHHPAQ